MGGGGALASGLSGAPQLPKSGKVKRTGEESKERENTRRGRAGIVRLELRTLE